MGEVGEKEEEDEDGEEDGQEEEELKEGNEEEKVEEEEVEVGTALSVEHSTTSSLSCSSRLTVAVSTLINIFEGPLTFDLRPSPPVFCVCVCVSLLLLCDGSRRRN